MAQSRSAKEVVVGEPEIFGQPDVAPVEEADGLPDVSHHIFRRTGADAAAEVAYQGAVVAVMGGSPGGVHLGPEGAVPHHFWNNCGLNYGLQSSRSAPAGRIAGGAQPSPHPGQAGEVRPLPRPTASTKARMVSSLAQQHIVTVARRLLSSWRRGDRPATRPRPWARRWSASS